MQELELPCDCHRLDCRLRLTLDDGTMRVEMIVPRRTFWTRLRNAFRYVFQTNTLDVADVVIRWNHETIVSVRSFFS